MGSGFSFGNQGRGQKLHLQEEKVTRRDEPLSQPQKSLLELNVLLYSGSKPMNLSQSSGYGKNTALLNCLSLCRASLRLSSFEFLLLRVPGETIRAQVWWRQSELLKTWLFLWPVWVAPTCPPAATPLTLGEEVASSLLCSRHPAQAKQPFWPEHLFTQFMPVADSATEKFPSNTSYQRESKSRKHPGWESISNPLQGWNSGNLSSHQGRLEQGFTLSLQAVGVRKEEVSQQLPFSTAIVILAFNSSLLAQEEGAADHETATRTSEEA